MVTNVTLLERARAAAASVTDPELPPLTIDELGILRDVRMNGGTVEVAITPTYSGCPAMTEIKGAIETAVRDAGAETVRVQARSDTGMDQRLVTETARGSFADLGIVPPERGHGVEELFGRVSVHARDADRRTRNGSVLLVDRV